MRKIVVTEFLSLDGVMEDPGGSEGTPQGGWTLKFSGPDQFQYKLDELFAHDALLLGRVTYEGFAEAWPGRTDDMGFADRMNAIEKYVVSSTLTHPGWSNTTAVGTDLAAIVADLRAAEGQDVLVAGSAQLVQGLVAQDLVDEYRLMVFPIVLGSGKRLFGERAGASMLELVDSRALASGTMILTYHPVR
jgi:dihydrofolate reductase